MKLASLRLVASSVAKAAGFAVPEPRDGPPPFAEAAQAASSSGRRVLMYLNNHFSAKAVANAAVLKHQLGDLVPGEYTREIVDRYPELGGIVTTSGLPL